MEDPDQLAVYDAQNLLMQCLDRALTSGVATLDGHEYRPEMEPRFSTPDDVDRYVHRVVTHLKDTGRDYDGHEQTIPRVRARQGRSMAHYEPASQVIAVPSYEIGGGWALRGVVVLHEIAHHLAPGVGHGVEFRAAFVRLLEDIGCPEQARLLQQIFQSADLSTVPYDVADDALERMAQILKQAENTPYEHERELFMDRAQALATRHQVALAVLRSRTDAAEREDEPRAETVKLGKRGTKGLNRMVMLIAGIGHVNNLQLTVAHDSTYVVLFGFVADIKVVKALYASLNTQLAGAWQRYFAENPTEPKLWTTSWRAVPTITRRLEFTSAFVESVNARLREARRLAIAAADRAAQAAAAEEGAAGASTNGQADGAGAGRDTDADGEVVAGSSRSPLDIAAKEAWPLETGSTGSGAAGSESAASGQTGPGQVGADRVDAASASAARSQGQSAALALRARELEVSEAFAEHMRLNKVRGTWRGARGAMGNSYQAPGASRAGHAAGQQASLGDDRPLPR